MKKSDERLSLNPFKLIRDTYRAILKEEKEIDLKRKEFQERWNKWGKDKPGPS